MSCPRMDCGWACWLHCSVPWTASETRRQAKLLPGALRTLLTMILGIPAPKRAAKAISVSCTSQ